MQQKTTPLIGQGWLRALLFFILLAVINYALYYFLLNYFRSDEMFPFVPGITMFIGSIFTAALITISLVYIFCRLIDKISIKSLGLAIDAKGMLSGFFLAASLLGTGAMILMMSGALDWVNWNFEGEEFFTSVVLMLLVAFSEELSFRGYVLGNLLRSFSRPVAIALSACAFVFMHAGNPGMQVIPVINLLLGGILLGQCYTINRNIWMPAGFHFAWNFLQGSVLGFRVSGLQLISVLDLQLTEREWITGGEFGFEGSIIATAVLITGVIILEVRSRLDIDTGISS